MLNLRLTPEVMIILPLALALDAISILLLCVGLDDIGICDTIGIVTIGSWIFFRTGMKVKIDDKQKKRILKFVGTSAGEIIPYLGALPFWTLMVLSALKENDQSPEEDNQVVEQENET